MSGSLLDRRPMRDQQLRKSSGRPQGDPYVMPVTGQFDLDAFAQPENLMVAYRMLEWHGGHAPGIDWITFKDLSSSQAYAALRRICGALKSGTYRPLPPRPVEYEKPNGGKRELSIQALLDRVVAKSLQLCTREVWKSTYPDQFKDYWTILAEIERDVVDTGYTYLHTADIDDFFPSLLIHDIMEAHYARLDNEDLLRIIGQVIRGHDGLDHTRGLAQGCPYSPLAADITLRHINIVAEATLGQCDTHPTRQWRYVDNYVYLCRDAQEGNRALTRDQAILGPHGLKLEDSGGFDLRDPKAKPATILGLVPHWDDTFSWTISEELWNKVGNNLDECWAQPGPLERGQAVIEGTLNALGPALLTADLQETVRKARKLAISRFHSPSSTSYLLSIGEKAIQRWKNHRDKVLKGLPRNGDPKKVLAVLPHPPAPIIGAPAATCESATDPGMPLDDDQEPPW